MLWHSMDIVTFLKRNTFALITSKWHNTRKPTSTYVGTNVFPVRFLPFHTFALIFWFIQAFSSTPPSSPLLLLHTGLPTSPFSPCLRTVGFHCHPGGARCWAVRGDPAPAPAGCHCLSLPPSLFLLLSCSLLRDLNSFWILSEGRGCVQLSAWERDSLPGITHPRASQGNQRFKGKAGESKNNICSWRWSRSVSYLLILIHQFSCKFTHCSSLFLISSSVHPNSHLFPFAHSL